MAYTRQTWLDGEAGGTPVDAARLNAMEAGIEGAAAVADTANAKVTPDATSAVKGVVRLTGDLGGTASAPTVPGLAARPVLAQVVTGGATRVPGGAFHFWNDPSTDPGTDAAPGDVWVGPLA